MPQTGLLVIFSSPSGVGKDSVIKGLLKLLPHAIRLVTTTSRPPRPGNKEGIDYYFISDEEFQERIEDHDFIEYNKFAGHYYGIPKKQLRELQKKYPLILTQTDINGKNNLEQAEIPCISIFLLPETMGTLRARLEHRHGLTKAEIDERLQIAKEEITHTSEYDYILVNYEGKLSETIKQAYNIINKHLDI
jgi:guanylate kinase